MAYAARLTRSRLVAGANRLAGLGYAVPGAVIAVGVLVPLGASTTRWPAGSSSAFGVHVGLLLTGTIAALVYAYLVRLLAVALQTIEAGPGQDHAEHGGRGALARRHARRRRWRACTCRCSRRASRPRRCWCSWT